LNLLLATSQMYIPGIIRNRKLDMLFDATASAFQVGNPATQGLSFNKRLNTYAQFTREQAQRAIQQGNELEVQHRLFENAYRLGLQLRTDFGIKTPIDVMKMGKVIYKLIKIDFHGEYSGNIVINRCFFSTYYSADICRVISSLDAGLLAGLSGGDHLVFSQRITEGKECCKARLEKTGV
jgi:hypothetical protein